MSVTIELPASVTITSRGMDVQVPTSGLTAEIVSKLACHGLIQKVSDAAASAMKLAAEELGKDATMESLKARAAELALPMMQKAADALVAGEWSSRVAGEGVDERTKVARVVMRNLMKDSVGAKSAAWAAFTGLSDAEQVAKIDANVEKNASVIEKAVDEEMKRREALRKAKEGMQSKVTVNL